MDKPFISIAHKYARDVVAKLIPANVQVYNACKRHMDDLKKHDWLYKFDEAKALKACRFIEQQYHTKGKWAAQGKKIELEPWQVFFVCSIFGWVNKLTGKRRFKRALLLVPRKNGKSILAAAIGLYMLMADEEHGAEVYSGATTEKQAWEVFRPARMMAQRNEDLKEYFEVTVNASNINLPDGSRFEPLVGKPGDGASPSCAITDEYHEHVTDELLDTMETGMGAREQPLSLVITTAGDNTSGPCYALQMEAQKILAGISDNDEFFALIYGIDPEDDWTSEEVIKKANPNYDISVSGDFLKLRLKEALSNARKQSTFKTKHLNVWVGAREAFFNIEQWNKCKIEDLDIEDFKNEPCIIGLDLASKVDIAALQLLFLLEDGRYATFRKSYLPEDTVNEPDNEHYRGWMLDGLLDVTEGQVTDYNMIFEDIVEFATKFTVVEVVYDPYQATMLVNNLMEQGIPCVEVRPTVLNLSEPMKAVEAAVRSKKLAHNGDPVMTWQIGNVVAKTDAKDNVYPRKNRPEDKIDNVVALIMAMARAIQGVKEQQCVYEDRGILMI